MQIYRYHRRKFGEITGGAEHYISHCTYIGTIVLESLAIIYFNKTIYKVRHTKQFNLNKVQKQ